MLAQARAIPECFAVPRANPTHLLWRVAAGEAGALRLEAWLGTVALVAEQMAAMGTLDREASPVGTAVPIVQAEPQGTVVRPWRDPNSRADVVTQAPAIQAEVPAAVLRTMTMAQVVEGAPAFTAAAEPADRASPAAAEGVVVPVDLLATKFRRHKA